jgi:DNA-binding response OmpR family regulator
MSIAGHATVRPVPLVLIATDADAVADEVAAAIEDEGTSVLRVRAGADVPGAVGEHEPDLVVLDLQIGNMGGMAVASHLRAEITMERLDDVAILMLLDRTADVFLAKRSDADGWVFKPLDSFRLRRAAKALLAGGDFREETGIESVPPVEPAPA